MWSSYRRPRRSTGAIGRTCIGLGFALSVASSWPSVRAAEVYVQPRADVRAEVDTNRSFATSGAKSTSEGYAADVGATWGIATPLSDTKISPQVGYVDYPKAHENALQASLDLSSSYHSQLSDFSLYGKFDRSTTYSSELASALFNPLLPNSPTTPETGRITTNTVRTLGRIVPSYSHNLSARTRIGFSGLYESTNYSGDFSSQYVSYDYALGRVFAAWAATPRMEISVGPFVSRDTAKSGGAGADGAGADLAVEYKWSRTFTGKLVLTEEHNTVKYAQPTPLRTGQNDFGATYTTTWSGQVSQLQLSTGRTYTPSGAGGKYQADQFQIEYDRKLSERFTSTYATRYIRSIALASQFQGADYKYLEAVAGFKWLAARTWYVSGGLQYQWLKYGSVNGSAGNGMVYVGFGYEGLGKRP
jgi:hypothetical protein